MAEKLMREHQEAEKLKDAEVEEAAKKLEKVSEELPL